MRDERIRTGGFRRRLGETPAWVWAVRLPLMFLGVALVHALWRMRLEASWGWAGFLRAALGGLLGGALWVAFDLLRRALPRRLPPSP